ncbi:MAG: hypothetical protein FWG89_08480 [Treponema sp.]|nr:hypothetical protein [Treponema sp.]
MNIESFNSVPSISIGYAINASQTGRASLPVSQSAYIYSHFKHVSGVPAPDGVEGVSINRLKILDTLIEQISKMKRDIEPLFDLQGQENDYNINNLINQYHTQIRDLQAANTNNPYATTAPLLGAVFNINI